jgi:hypothetical protein
MTFVATSIVAPHTLRRPRKNLGFLWIRVADEGVYHGNNDVVSYYLEVIA